MEVGMNLQDEIAKVAHELFERDGRRHGLALDHWLEAEKIVKARQSKKGKAVAGPAKTAETASPKTVAKKSAPVKEPAKKTVRAKKAK